MRHTFQSFAGALASLPLAAVVALTACRDATEPEATRPISRSVSPAAPASDSGAARTAADPVPAALAAATTLQIDVGGARVGAGLIAGPYRVTLPAPAPASGTIVTLTSGNPAVLQLSPTGATTSAASIQVAVGQGSTQATFFIQGVESQTGLTTVTATATGEMSITATGVTVAPAIIEILGLAPTTSVNAVDDVFEVRVGAANATGTLLIAEQPVRPGHTLPVTVASSAPSAASLKFSGGAAASGTVTLLAGVSRSPGSVAAGGVALDPLAVGTTSVSATSTLTLEAAGATRAVTVGAASLRTNVSGARVGSGLVAGVYSVTLDGPAPAGGVAVTITSADGTLLRVSPTATTAGASAITVTVPQGQTTAYFCIQGVEGRTGATTVVASASGYLSATGSDVGVVTPLVAIVGLEAAKSSTSPDDPFQVRVGIPNASTGTLITSEQSVRAGGALAVTVTNGTPAVGRLLFAGGAAQSGTVTIPAGQSRSPNTVAAGGVAFDALAGGTTRVDAVAAAAGEATDASVTVTVAAAAGITTTVNNAVVGSGLLEGAYYARLSAPAGVGGVPVTITSSNGALLQLSRDATTAGASSIAVTVPQGQTQAPFYIQGVENQAGTASVTISAPGHATATGTNIRVVTPGIDIANLDLAPTSISPDDPFQVRIGVPGGANAYVASEQRVRPGGAVTITLTNGAAAAGRLVFVAGPAQSGTVTIVAGQARSASTVATGGVAFDPLAAGTTVVSAASAAALEMTGATSTVTVAPPGITVNTAGARVGAGLTYGAFTVRLGAPAVGVPAVVTLTSSAPGVLQLAPTATSVGAGTITLTIPVGQTTANFHIQGVEGQRGIATITATAAGYTKGASTAEVVPALIDIVSLPSSIAAAAVNAPFSVRVGAGNATGTIMSIEQAVRAGGSLTVTVTNSNAAAARLVSGASMGQSVTLTIGAGGSRTPSSTTGGVAFDPLAAGATIVRATSTAAAVIAGTNATWGVTVTP
jgi:hypothetical protein